MPQNIITDKEIVFYADEKIFSINTIMKCLYWYSARFSITIQSIDKFYKIILKTNENEHLLDLNKELINLERDLIDFNLREIVYKETKNIRELLIAKAFSYGVDK